MPVATWTRADHLRRLQDGTGYDVLVVGGGVIGTGTALDLAARGLRVALVERTDIASGASSRSTKLLHGGVRYLPRYRFRLIAEGLREQAVLSRTAGILHRPLEFVIPVYEDHRLADAPAWASRGWRAPVALEAGLTAYDLLGRRGRAHRHRRLSAAAVGAAFPSLRPSGLRAGFAFWDAQTDDARLVVALAKTAVRFGAVVTTYLAVDRIERAGSGFVAHLTDATGSCFPVRTRAVVAATGATPPPSVGTGSRRPGVVLSKGTHLVLETAPLGLGDRALVLPETDDGRVLFVIPWQGHTLVGTTDEPYRGDPTRPAPGDADVEYLLRHLHRYLDVGPVTPLAAFAGVRTLVAEGDTPTARLSRERALWQPAPGYVAVAGGKLTTYRRIAAEAADVVARHLGVDRASSTADIRLEGSEVAAGAIAALRRAGIPESSLASILARQGGNVGRIASLAEAEPVLREPVAGSPLIAAEVAHAVRHESAVEVADVTLRRTHLAWFSPDHGRSLAPAIARIMASELRWSDAETAAHLRAHEQALLAGRL